MKIGSTPTTKDNINKLRRMDEKLKVLIVSKKSIDNPFIEVGKEYIVKYKYVLDGKLLGYYIGTERNLWLVSTEQAKELPILTNK